MSATEAERRAACRKVAEDMARAGLGWHEDELLRFTAPPIGTVAERAEAWAYIQREMAQGARRAAGIRRRQRRRARKARRK
jgi:hypothetical protein